MIHVSGESKSRLVKAAGAESCGQRRNQKLHAAVARSTFSSENVQNTSAPDRFLKFWWRKIVRRCGDKHILKSKLKSWGSQSSFWRSDVGKLHAAVARSIFKSKCTKHVRFGPLFKFRCRKFARRCGEKRIFKSKCSKIDGLGALFEVPLSKNCTPLWREAHFQVKMHKMPLFWRTFWSSDVEKLVR